MSTFVVETEAPSPEKENISNANLAKMGFVVLSHKHAVSEWGVEMVG